MTIKEFLQDHCLITDGATGTYYAQITGDSSGFSELATLTHPEIISRIHREYIEAGARLIRTNTFGVNPITLGQSRAEVARLLTASFALAREAAAGHDIFIAANIGPIPESSPSSPNLGQDRLLDEYRFIVDTFQAAGALIYNFETFSNPDLLPLIAAYIKSRQPEGYVITQFAVTADGLTRKGVSAARILQTIKQCPAIDACGFNCGAGPTHLYQTMQRLDLSDAVISALPNAGYPEIVNERTIYIHNPLYFAERINDLTHLGAKIVGGCCGTTPAHIQAICAALSPPPPVIVNVADASVPPSSPAAAKPVNPFWRKLQQGQFVFAAELDPPFDASPATLIDRAHVYRQAGIDIITIADSPLAKARADSVIIAAKIKRETGVEALPHLCCRDRNVNALKASVLGAHIEGIRNILAVTGDPLPSATKQDIKSVFNLNSLQLISFLRELNATVFSEDPLQIGGALNLNVPGKETERHRMEQKAERGATFFLTQPIFRDDVIEFLATIKKTPDVKILGGILPLVNYKHALFLKNEVPGVAISDSLLNRFHPEMDRQTAEQVGIALAVELAAKIRPYVDGLYIMTSFNRAAMVVKIIQEVRHNL